MAKYGEHGLNVIVMIVDKRSLSKSDVVKAVGYATEYKTVSLIITTAKKAPEHSIQGNLVNIIKVQ